MLRIGAVARLLGVSTRTLRHYHAVGVLSPAQVDPRTGYRGYSLEQVDLAQRVIAIRQLGVSLAAIQGLLAGPRPEAAIAEVLVAHKRLLERQRTAIEGQLTMLDLEIRRAEQSAAARPFVVKRIPSRWTMSLRRQVRTYPEADDLLATLRRMAGSVSDVTPGFIWHSCRPMEQAIDCEALLLLDREPRRPGVSVRQIPSELVVSFAHTGSDGELPRIYDELRSWSSSIGAPIRGPLRELYWEETGARVTEVQFSVEPGDLRI